MKWYFYKGLRFKIAATFGILFAIISVAFSHYTYQYFSTTLTQNYNRYLFSRAKSVLSKTELNPVIIALPDSGEFIRVFYHNQQQQPVILFQSPGGIQQVSVPYSSGVTDTLGMYAVYLKQEDSNGLPVELMLGVPNAYFHEKLNHLQWLMVVSTLVSVVLGTLIIYMAAGWLLKPVRAIITNAKQIDLENLTKRVPVSSSHDELQELSETFNAMLARIEQEQQQQNAFFAAASHELKTPLAILQAQTEYHLAQNEVYGNANLLKSQLEEVKRLQQVVRQFLATSEIKHSNFHLQQIQVDLTDQLLRIFERNKDLLQRKQLQPLLDFDEKTADYTISGDYDKLDIVWQNLLQNAIQHTPTGGYIRVTVTCNEAQTTITFVNSIAAAIIDVANLGNAFYRKSGLPDGTGLGLWLSRSIVTLHQGKLLINSNNHEFKVTVTIPNQQSIG